MAELKAKRMDLPPPASENEFSKCEMGNFVEPSIEKKLGLRTECFSDSEKNATEFVISRIEENGNDIENYDENHGDTISNLNTGNFRIIMSEVKGEDFSINHAFPLRYLLINLLVSLLVQYFRFLAKLVVTLINCSLHVNFMHATFTLYTFVFVRIVSRDQLAD